MLEWYVRAAASAISRVAIGLLRGGAPRLPSHSVWLRRATPAAAAIPALAVLVGFVVGTRHGAPPLAFVPNVVGMALGSAAFFVARRRSAMLTRRAPLLAAVAVLALLLTLACPGIDGVRRWIPVGVLSIHVSAVVAPVLLWAIHAVRSEATAVALIGATCVVHVLQPDAGQATAFGCAALVLYARSDSAGRAARALGCALAVGGIAIAWLRADPLAPVDHVERVLRLALEAGWPLALAACAALVALLVPMVWLARESSSSRRRSLAASLGTYTVTSLAVTELGHFPVPVLGAGVGPVLGWYAALAALAASSLAEDGAARHVSIRTNARPTSMP